MDSSLITIEFAKIVPFIATFALIGLFLGLIVNFFGEILEFVLTLKPIRYAFLAIILVIAIKNLVW